MEFLSSIRVERALRRLAVLASAEHLALEFALCYGKVIVVVFGAVDVRSEYTTVVEPTSRSDALVQKVTLEMRLPDDWWKEDLKYYLAMFKARRRQDFGLFAPSLILSVSETTHVLAMRLHACAALPVPATSDIADVEHLIQNLELTSWADVAAIYERHFPGHPLNGDMRCLVLEMFKVPDRSSSL
jgi:hypothetical protein